MANRVHASARIALVSLLLTAVLALQPTTSRAFDRADANQAADPAADAVPADEGRQVPGHAAIALVSATSAEELFDLIGELLNRKSISCDLSRASRFDADDLFAHAERDADVRVFIRIEAERVARLYFRGPGGERFLLRKIELAHGLDEVGRELVAQVVESSVVALLRSSIGLSREQASLEVARETSAQKSAPPTPRSALPAAGAVPIRRLNQPASPFELLLGLRYGVRFSGPDLYLAHGPGLEFGLGLRRVWLWRARLSAEHLLPQRLKVREVSASVLTNALRASLDLGLPLGAGQSAVFALGGGVDVAGVDADVYASDVTPVETRSELVPTVRAEVRYEAVRRPFLLAIASFADLALLDTHYDLVDRGARQRLAVPWRLRPGATLAFGLAW